VDAGEIETGGGSFDASGAFLSTTVSAATLHCIVSVIDRQTQSCNDG